MSWTLIGRTFFSVHLPYLNQWAAAKEKKLQEVGRWGRSNISAGIQLFASARPSAAGWQGWMWNTCWNKHMKSWRLLNQIIRSWRTHNSPSGPCCHQAAPHVTEAWIKYDANTKHTNQGIFKQLFKFIVTKVPRNVFRRDRWNRSSSTRRCCC